MRDARPSRCPVQHLRGFLKRRRVIGHHTSAACCSPSFDAFSAEKVGRMPLTIVKPLLHLIVLASLAVMLEESWNVAAFGTRERL